MQAYRTAETQLLILATDGSCQFYAPADLPPLNRKLEWASQLV
jgi:hypothetical protein